MSYFDKKVTHEHIVLYLEFVGSLYQPSLPMSIKHIL